MARKKSTITKKAVAKKAARKGKGVRVVNKGGKPTLYRKEYDEQARKLCLLGFNNEQLADFFNVVPQTIYHWKNRHKSFAQALSMGGAIADANVTASFYERCLGYSHPETHVAVFQGEVIKTELVKHYPPDASAAMNWLKNRQPGLWRDKMDVDTPADGVLAQLASKLQGKALGPVSDPNAERVIDGYAEVIDDDAETGS